MTDLSRRQLLTGIAVTAAAATLPAVATPMENPCAAVIFAPDTHCALGGYHDPKYYLYPTQWERWTKHFGADFMERRCARIETMPADLIRHTERMSRGARRSAIYTPEITNERQAQRLPVPRHHQGRKRQYGPKPPVAEDIRSFRRTA